MATAKRKKRTGTVWRPLLKGTALAAGVLILAVLVMTLFIYLEWLPESAIPAGNTVIKILTALAAGIFIGTGQGRAPWYFGGIAAVLALSVSVVLMAVYTGSFKPTWNLAADVLMCLAIGSAATAVFLRRKQNA